MQLPKPDQSLVEVRVVGYFMVDLHHHCTMSGFDIGLANIAQDILFGSNGTTTKAIVELSQSYRQHLIHLSILKSSQSLARNDFCCVITLACDLSSEEGRPVRLEGSVITPCCHILSKSTAQDPGLVGSDVCC